MSILLLAALSCGLSGAGAPDAVRVPIVYSTDLFHPHADPDDHYDLACLFALPEFDIRGIILDLGAEQAKRTGRAPLEQMIKITGRRVSCAIGLSRKLRERSDTGLDQPSEFQGGVELILRSLRESPGHVTIFTTGSCRDVAAALNREPELFRKQVLAVYINIGRGPNEEQKECNVGYDSDSFMRLLESGLPVYWCPCFGRDGYETLYQVDQAAVVGACRPAVRNFFAYCLSRSKADPLEFLASGPQPLPKGPRSMWCTAPMFHAAGRKIYERRPGDFVALARAEAARRGLVEREVKAFEFAPMRPTVEGAGFGILKVDLKPAQPRGYVFRSTDARYRQIMASCLKNLLSGL